MVLDEEMLNTKSFFNSRDIPLSDFWLESCIKWWREQNAAQNYSPEQLKNVVYEQWLLLDLREVELPSLPPHLKDHKKLTFNGNYCLQVMCVVDISKPKHWQLSKIRNANALTSALDNDKDLTSSKRMLQLTLTDGVQEVDAIEYELIPLLKLSMTPGIKIRLTGPVTVRRGKIMLEARNVKVLGGEVEEILVSNAVENLLSRALGLPENPNPVSVNVETVNLHADNAVPHNNTSNRTINNVSNKSKNLDTISRHSKVVENLNNKKSSTRPEHHLFDDMNEEEEMRIAEEVESLLEAVPGPSRLSERHQTPDMFEDDDYPDDIRNYTHKSAVEKEIDTINILNSSAESDIFKNIDIDSHLDRIDKKTKEIQEINIKDLLKKQQSIAKGVFRTKAKFKGVIEKLTVTNTAWSFKIEIQDDSGSMVADMHTDVITKMAECHPSTIMDLKNNLDDTNKSAELRIRNVLFINRFLSTFLNFCIFQVLANFKKKLLVLDCSMQIKITNGDTPTITEVYL